MELNDAFRRIVIGHLPWLVAFVLLPALATGWLATRTRTEYSSSARIQASSATIGSDTEADSVLNRVRGVATSQAIVGQALTAGGVADRSAAVIANEVTVSRLGSSALLDLTVTDADPAVARQATNALATRIVDFLTVGGNRQTQGLLSQLTYQQGSLSSERQVLVRQLSTARTNDARASLSSQLFALDQQLNDVGSTLRQLQVAIATDSSASLVSPASAAKAVRSNIAIRTVLGLVAGLVAGLLVASLLEVVRPRVPDASSFAQAIGVPLLGRIQAVGRDDRPVDDAAAAAGARAPFRATEEGVLSLRYAASRADAHTLVLVGEPDRARATELAATLTAQLSRAPEVQPLSNGHAGNARSAVAGPGTSGRVTKTTTRTRPKTAELNAVLDQRPIQVVRLPDLAQRTLSRDTAILVVVADRAPYRHLAGVEDLAAATGWPIIGVLGEPRCRRGWLQ